MDISKLKASCQLAELRAHSNPSEGNLAVLAEARYAYEDALAEEGGDTEKKTEDEDQEILIDLENLILQVGNRTFKLTPVLENSHPVSVSLSEIPAPVEPVQLQIVPLPLEPLEEIVISEALEPVQEVTDPLPAPVQEAIPAKETKAKESTKKEKS